MKLYLSPTSPFARKVKVALLEKDLERQTQWLVLDPWASPDELLAVNPLSQVPALVLDDGRTLTGSDTILGGLESLYPEPSLLPIGTDAVLRTLAVAGLAHGLIECIVATVLERRRPAEQQSAKAIARKRSAIVRVLKTLSREFNCSTEQFQLDGIGLACALEYLDFRLPDHEWRGEHPALAEWLGWAAARASMQASAPPREKSS
ncbi:MAG: glutathione S-transferase N-terminal domain-containing protein [Gammaproteobacteria bacterium]